MKKTIKYIVTFLLVAVIAFLFLYINNDIGIRKSNIENDARASQKISDSWQVSKQTTEKMSAMIFYNKDFSDHTFSIYVNRGGLSFGYFFRGGGTISVTNDQIAEFHIEGYNENTYISMNKQKICKVEIDDGKTVEKIDIDSTKPFAFISKENAGSITFYDAQGNVLEAVKVNL